MTIKSLILGKGTTCDVYTVVQGQDTQGGPTETDTARLTAVPCWRQTLSGNEGIVVGRHGISASHRFFFLPDVTILATDEIRTGGRIYEVLYNDNPEVFTHHFEVLTKLRG